MYNDFNMPLSFNNDSEVSDVLENTNKVNQFIIKRLFNPYKKYNKINPWWKNILITNESVSSVTPVNTANIITTFIINNYKNYFGYTPSYIIDATANVGGNTISFGQYFKKVSSFEIKQKTYQMLKNNIKLYNFKNIDVINDDFNKYLYYPLNNMLKTADIIFIDPPWFINGKENIDLICNYKLNTFNITIVDIILRLLNIGPKMIVIKTPKNYKCKLYETIRLQLNKMDILIYCIKN
jgi:16S rRNA G966 N2-methylase RsmD